QHLLDHPHLHSFPTRRSSDLNKEADERERVESENLALTDAQKFVGRISGLMNPLTYIVVNGGIIALIYAGALRVQAGDLTRGEVDRKSTRLNSSHVSISYAVF